MGNHRGASGAEKLQLALVPQAVHVSFLGSARQCS